MEGSSFYRLASHGGAPAPRRAAARTPSFASASQGGPDLGREPLKLGELIGAHEPDTKVVDSSRSLPFKGREPPEGYAVALRAVGELVERADRELLHLEADL